MPSFGRIGKLNNRSQHNLLEQQQAQQQAQQQQAALQHQIHLQQQQQQQQQQHPHQTTPAAVGSGGGVALPLSQPSSSAVSPSLSQQSPIPLRRVSTAGIGPDSSNNPASASSGPPPSLGSTDSFHRQHPQQQQPLSPQQQQQQGQQQQQQQSQPPHSHQQQLQQPDIRAGQSSHPSSQLQAQQTQRQQHQSHFPLINLNNGQPQVLRNTNPILSPPPSQGPTAIPLNQPNPNSHNHSPSSSSSPVPNPNPNSNPAAVYGTRQQQQQQARALHDNFAELVSRSQSSARYSQVIAPLQTQPPFDIGIASSSADDLPRTASGNSSSPTLHQGSLSAPHGHNLPSEPKRSARKLIRHLISGSSSKPSLDSYDSSYDSKSAAAGVVRRPSKRSSNIPKGNPLLARSIDHPDWVAPPQRSSSRPNQQQQQAPPHAQQPPSQPLPSQVLKELDNSYPTNRSNKDLLAPSSQEALQNTIRHVPPQVAESSPSDQEDLAFHQQQAIAQHQALLLQQQGQTPGPPPQAQPQTEGQTQTHPYQQSPQQFGQIIVDPAQSPYAYGQSQEQYQDSSSQPSAYVGHLSTENSQPPNPETVSQLSHESPTPDSEQAHDNYHSVQESPAVGQAAHEPLLASVQQSQQSQLSAPQGMPNTAPPPGPPGQGRRSADNDSKMRSADAPPGPPPSYRHSQGPLNTLSPLPPSAGSGNAPPSFRSSGTGERQQFEVSAAEDRNRTNSPQPSEGVDHEKQFKDLVTKYKNVKRLYFDGKTQIEQMTSQIVQLQNAVANQRMSQSRTALDDNEYLTRFNRLNGAINNLSFNIRKDWHSLPSWIERYVSPEAVKTGKQEMTAVGRAIISRWIMDEIFNKCFHPGLDVGLSCHLKQIEQNIRKFSYTMNSQEEFDALTAKVVSWRMTTLEGLGHMLNSPESAEYRADFTKMTTSNLTAGLYQYLSDPPPAGVDGSASMIVELAVGIAANLPLESRDVALTFPMPGDAVQLDIMDVEKSSFPPLPVAEASEEGEENAKDGDKAGKRGDKTRSGMLTMLGGVPHPASSRKGSTASILTDTAAPAAPAAATATPPAADTPTVRFAAFMGVEVRGRQVLQKAPVWTLA